MTSRETGSPYISWSATGKGTPAPTCSHSESALKIEQMFDIVTVKGSLTWDKPGHHPRGGSVPDDTDRCETSYVSTHPYGPTRPTLRGMSKWDDFERAALVALLRTRPEGLTWAQITSEVADASSACAVWKRYRVPNLFDEDLTSEGTVDATLASAMEEVNDWQKANFTFLTFPDEGYPAQLREVHQIPPVLFTKGTFGPNEQAVSVVGSRKASESAIRIATEISKGLVECELTVLSGLAEGIDTAAHISALQSNGRTVAVIGTGISKYFPAFNHSLQDRIANEGLVISQFWPDANGSKNSFPMRNATMSAYGIATIIVEASERSGTRIQARSAVAHGRPVILMESVARGTNWGRDLRDKPGVYVAETPQNAVELAQGIAREQELLLNLLEITRG